mgnify:CR=1 FL=1
MASIVVAGDTSGSVTIAAPAVAGSSTLTLPTGTGTFSVNGASTNIVTGTAQNSTSGTTITFTGIPSWAKRITVLFNGVSTSGGSDLLIQIGSGSLTTTGYLGASTSTVGATVGSTNYTTGFGLRAGGTALGAIIRHGSCTICTLGSNIWVESGVFAHSNEAANFYSAGSVTLSGALDRVAFTTVNGTDTFDAGSINILYE